MSFQFASASKQHLSRDKVVYSVPMTLYCEAMPFQTNAHNIAFAQSTPPGASKPWYSIWLTNGGKIWAYKRDYAATSWGTAEAPISYAANTWYRIAATFGDDVVVWVNGGNRAAAGVACSAEFSWDMTHIDIGGFWTGGSFWHGFNGRVCNCAIWPVVLTDAQCISLTGGQVLPEDVRPDVLAGFWPGGGRYGRNYLDFSGRKPPVPMSPENGPTWGSDPWRRSPSRRLVVPAAVATGAGAQLHYNRCLRVA